MKKVLILIICFGLVSCNWCPLEDQTQCDNNSAPTQHQSSNVPLWNPLAGGPYLTPLHNPALSPLFHH